METTLIVGCGYLGRHVATALRDAGRPLLALTGHADTAAALRAQGFAAHPVDLDGTATCPLPEGTYRILYLVPPDGAGDGDLRLQHFLDGLAGRPPARFVYASSSAVYGDRKGAWVDEDLPVTAQSTTAARRIDAENRLRNWSAERGISHVVLRIAGIYGPGRLPLERLRTGRPAVREEEAGWSNRIHIDDLTRVCLAALDHPSPGSLYNVADGTPTSTTAFLQAVARCCGLPAPALVSLDDALGSATPGQARFLLESRRLATARMRQDLVREMLYPDVDAAFLRPRRDGAC